LTKDIDLSGEDWTPIDRFQGTFDGQGYVIKNMTTSMQSVTYSGGAYECAGLFAWISAPAIVKNLGIEDCIAQSNATGTGVNSGAGAGGITRLCSHKRYGIIEK